ncbi:MAG TPA: aminotransferase class I/II-fold pyridoxal phosphate-dependent enzyme [Candidatus Limnocylindria bacterium]|nr:aminotransferase class I/II-fold pyridoxal phosphate-dependent enzyme [Candidatus Limnocylindria bacterium]
MKDAPRENELQRTGPVTVLDGKSELWYFAGCDYLGMAWEPIVSEQAAHVAEAFGFSVAASRRTTGNHPLYLDLETSLAAFFKAPRTLLVSCGYLTNLCVAQAMAGRIDTVYIDEKAHASLQDATLHFGASRIVSFDHRSSRHLAQLLEAKGPSERIIVLTDGLFASDGSLAPLAAYHKLLPESGWLLVDDAHAAGVLGRQGHGSLEQHRLPYDRVIQTVTLSKAFGAGGGAINASVEIIERIKTASRAFIGSTPPPLPVAAAALASTLLLVFEDRLRNLRKNVAIVRKAVREAGWKVSMSPGPVIALTTEDRKLRNRLEKSFKKHRIHFPWIVYPGGAEGGYLRLAISSAHPPEAIKALGRALLETGKTE